MKLYHGSNIEFDKIDLAKSKPTDSRTESPIHERNHNTIFLWYRKGDSISKTS